MTTTIRKGDHVRISGDHSHAGTSGVVTEILRADRYMERRAIIRVTDAYRPMVAMKFLTLVEE